MRIWNVVAAVAAAALLSPFGCGKDLCEEAYDKGETCIESLTCKGADPVQLQQCEASKKAFRQVNETAFKLACDEAEAQKYIDCALDPLTCRCP